jgi:hypothetical protein
MLSVLEALHPTGIDHLGRPLRRFRWGLYIGYNPDKLTEQCRSHAIRHALSSDYGTSGTRDPMSLGAV